MHARTAKKEALEAIARLPDTASMEDIMYRLQVLENRRRGRQEADAGPVRRLGFLAGRLQVPEDCDRMGTDTIAQLFGGDGA